MAQAIPVEELANQRLNVLVNALTLFLKHLSDEGLDLEKVKAASDKTWAALGVATGKQLKELFQDAPTHEAGFTSSRMASEVHGMEIEEEIDKLAVLAKMELTDDEKSKYAKQLTSILDYVEKINEADTGDIDFKTHVDIKNVFKSDEPGKSLNQEDAVSQAKNKGGYILINRVLND